MPTERLSYHQRATLELLRHEKSPLTAREVKEWVGSAPSVLRALERRGLVKRNANHYWEITGPGLDAIAASSAAREATDA